MRKKTFFRKTLFVGNNLLEAASHVSNAGHDGLQAINKTHHSKEHEHQKHHRRRCFRRSRLRSLCDPVKQRSEVQQSGHVH